MKKVLLFLSFLFISTVVFAQVVNIPKDASGVVGTSYKVALAQATTAREFLLVQNSSASNYIAFTFDNTVPVINGQGSITLAPYQIYNAYSEWIPAAGINVVGSGAGSVYTIKYR